MTRLGLLAAAGVLAASVPAAAQTLTPVASFDHQVTGVAVTADGRRFVNFPRWTEDAPISVAEVAEDGSLRAYPDARWNSWRNARANELPVADYFVCVQSIVPDGRGNLWVVDAGAPGNEKILEGAPKLVRISLATNQVTKVIAIPATSRCRAPTSTTSASRPTAPPATSPTAARVARSSWSTSPAAARGARSTAALRRRSTRR